MRQGAGWRWTAWAGASALALVAACGGEDRGGGGGLPLADPWTVDLRDGVMWTPAPERAPLATTFHEGESLPLGALCSTDDQCRSARCVLSQCYPADVTPETGMSFVPPGWAVVGSEARENGRRAGREFDRSNVLLSQGFLMDRTPVTEGQWRALMNNRRASANVACGMDCPVERVTWWSALEFANRRSLAAGLTPCYDLSEIDCVGDPERGQMTCSPEIPLWSTYGDTFHVPGCDGYRLPGELEWEHAFRGGSTTAFPGGDLSGNPRACDEQPGDLGAGWHCGSTDQKQPVALLEPNGYLLYDMAGNVREWMADVYRDAEVWIEQTVYGYRGRQLLYMELPLISDDADGDPNHVLRRVQRGGSWRERPEWARASARVGADANQRHQLFGFRLVRSVETGEFAVRTERCRVGMDACTDFRECVECLGCEASELGEGVCVQPGTAYIPSGSFLMGSPETESGRGDDEPQREITLTKSFTAGRTEVTVAEWRRVMGTDPSQDRDCGDQCPVNRVSWWSALAFANALSEEAALPPCYDFSDLTCTGDAARGTLDCGIGFPDLVTEAIDPDFGGGVKWYFTEGECIGFRLPTEAEWEYMARAGSEGPYQDPSIASAGAQKSRSQDRRGTGSTKGVSCGGIEAWNTTLPLAPLL